MNAICICISDRHWNLIASSYFDLATTNSGISLLSPIDTRSTPASRSPSPAPSCPPGAATASSNFDETAAETAGGVSVTRDVPGTVRVTDGARVAVVVTGATAEEKGSFPESAFLEGAPPAGVGAGDDADPGGLSPSLLVVVALGLGGLLSSTDGVDTGGGGLPFAFEGVAAAGDGGSGGGGVGVGAGFISGASPYFTGTSLS